MFIYSAKMDKKKLFTLLACGGIAVLVLVLVLCRGCGGERSASSVVGTETVEVAAAPKSVAKLIKKARINTPEDAAELGVADKQIVKVALNTARPLIFDDVVVRVSPKFALAMHIDTDECNAACAFGEVFGEIVK